MNENLQALQQAKENYKYFDVMFYQEGPFHMYSVRDIETNEVYFNGHPDTDGLCLGCCYNNGLNDMFIDLTPYKYCKHEFYSDSETFDFTNKDTDKIIILFKQERALDKMQKANLGRPL